MKNALPKICNGIFVSCDCIHMYVWKKCAVHEHDLSKAQGWERVLPTMAYTWRVAQMGYLFQAL